MRDGFRRCGLVWSINKRAKTKSFSAASGRKAAADLTEGGAGGNGAPEQSRGSERKICAPLLLAGWEET